MADMGHPFLGMVSHHMNGACDEKVSWGSMGDVPCYVMMFDYRATTMGVVTVVISRNHGKWKQVMSKNMTVNHDDFIYNLLFAHRFFLSSNVVIDPALLVGGQTGSLQQNGIRHAGWSSDGLSHDIARDLHNPRRHGNQYYCNHYHLRYLWKYMEP